MALVVNGQRVEWAGYEYGLRGTCGNGYYYEAHPNYSAAIEAQEDYAAKGRHTELIFRTKYVNGWEPCK